jgi:O-6-methylguanine DNA methyltransferase
MKKIVAKAGFREKVLDVVRGIKEGKVMTYKSVAEKAGNKNASRAVGNFMKANFDKTVPCHRVVRSDGVVGDYNRGGKTKKMAILKKEGIKFNGEKVILK